MTQCTQPQDDVGRVPHPQAVLVVVGKVLFVPDKAALMTRNGEHIFAVNFNLRVPRILPYRRGVVCYTPCQRKVVIGSGAAGLLSVIIANGLGKTCALVEQHAMGGDCLNVGCVPSKVTTQPIGLCHLRQSLF